VIRNRLIENSRVYMVLKRELSANHWNVSIVSLQMCVTYNKGIRNFLVTIILLCTLYIRIQDELAPKGWPAVFFSIRGVLLLKKI
jgi:hypothetical protein